MDSSFVQKRRWSIKGATTRFLRFALGYRSCSSVNFFRRVVFGGIKWYNMYPKEKEDERRQIQTACYKPWLNFN